MGGPAHGLVEVVVVLLGDMDEFFAKMAPGAGRQRVAIADDDEGRIRRDTCAPIEN